MTCSWLLLSATNVEMVMPEEDEPLDLAMIEVLNEPLISAVAERLDDVHDLVLISTNDVQLLRAADVGVVMPEEDEPLDPAMIEVLNEPMDSAVAERLDNVHDLVLISTNDVAASTVPVERLNDIHAEGSGFDIAMNPVVPEDVDTSTLVLTGVANESALISSAVVVLDGLLLESVPAVSTVPDVVRLGFTTDVLLLKAADVGVVMPEEDEPSDPAMIEVLNEPLVSTAAEKLDDIHVEGSGFDIQCYKSCGA